MTEPRGARTLQDLIDEGRASAFAARIEHRPESSVPYFRCRCGRTVRADMMLDLAPEGCEGVCPTIRGKDRFRCDACWHRWLLGRKLTSEELRAAINPPADTAASLGREDVDVRHGRAATIEPNV